MSSSDDRQFSVGGGCRLWAPWFVLGLALAVTTLVTLYVSASSQENDAIRFERRIAEATRDIEDRMATYVALLHGVSGLFAASEKITYEEFERYVERLKLDEEYGGVQGIGVAALVPPGRADDLEDWMLAQRNERFTIWPEGPGEQSFVTLFLQPEDQRNRTAIGFDMFSDPLRRQALERARDQGTAAASGRVQLVGSDAVGFTVYVPIYRHGETPATVEARRERIVGFAFSPFSANELFRHAFSGRTRSDLSIRVYDTVSTDVSRLLFDTPSDDEEVDPEDRQADRDPAAHFTPRFHHETTIQVAGRPWTLVFTSRPAFESQSFASVLVPMTMLAGLMVSLLLFGVTLAQANAHEKAERAAAELRLSETALRNSEARLQLAMSAANSFAVTWEAATDELRYVGEVRRVLGIQPATGEEFAMMIHPDDRLRVEQVTAQALATESAHEVEFRVVRDDGSIVWLRDRGVVELDKAGSPCRMIGVLADVTRQKEVEFALRALNETLEQRVADRAEEAERRSEQLRALASELTQAEQRERRRLAQVLHDHLQQLLVASMMRMGPIRKKAPPELDESLKQVEELIRQSISSSRSLTIELSPPVLYDAGLCKGLEWLVRSMTDKHDIQIHLSCDPEADPEGEDLRAFLFQAVRELLFNIVKHSDAREAWITVSRDVDDGVRIVVEDHGQGFDPSILRVQGAMAEHFGLFSIQQRLELLGGQLQVESPIAELGEDRGSRIVLRAPLDHVVEESVPVSQILGDLPESEEYSTAEKLLQAYTHPSPERTAIRVLLADDHDVLRDGLSTLLHAQEGIEVVGEARDGNEVVQMAARLHPDVVVMDVTMPRIDGVEATRRIVAENPKIRIIGLSMHTSEDRARAMSEAGAYAYVSKTHPTSELLRYIRGEGGSTEA